MSMQTIPKHIAIIMDGSGRWAERRMLPRVAGHPRGVDAARATVQYCIDHNISALTLFAFSSENWQRPAAEVKLLMTLLQKLLIEEAHQLNDNNVKLLVIGDMSRLSLPLQAAIQDAHNLTANNTGLHLNIALNYGGRWDIVQATRKICSAVANGEITASDINDSLFAQYLTLSDLPDPDLLIRTSGEQRVSNFLLWQLEYTELYFTSTLWPDFNKQDLDAALEFYAQRHRRFGLVEEHV